jgi:hypothetical protein
MHFNDPAEARDLAPEPKLQPVAQRPFGARTADAAPRKPNQEVSAVDAHHLDVSAIGPYRWPHAIHNDFRFHLIDRDLLHYPALLQISAQESTSTLNVRL